jgi:hypothetical protein
LSDGLIDVAAFNNKDNKKLRIDYFFQDKPMKTRNAGKVAIGKPPL